MQDLSLRRSEKMLKYQSMHDLATNVDIYKGLVVNSLWEA